ncbi:cell division protein FtsX [Bacteroides sp. 214]|uniref:cell division protein FtsX n=1 Tax=Bacteroides sp. 214 TaxID=2302935 RepID=UPI0013CF869F|nr:permease-like cell division protein FtsX [Bacteroides sp. 214]NDW13867.1 cell division protein FtsX [Bacteroides sp. 214]
MKNKHKSSNAPSFFDMQFITSTISTMMVLLLLGLVVFSILAADNLSTFVRESFSFEIVISDNMKEADILMLQKKLSKESFVKEAVYISKQAALEEHIKDLGTDPREFLGTNPFKSSIEIKLRSEYANTDSIAKIESSIRKNINIQEVEYRKELIDAVNSNLQTISLVLLGLAAVLTLISFALINNTIRLTIYSKRFLIHTMKLVGASWGFIRKPFIARNVWSGVLAAFLANTILIGVAYWLIDSEPDLIRVITPHTILIVMGAVLGFGIIITSFCAYISLNKYLRMKANTLYYI